MKIPDDLFRTARVKAILEGTSVSAVVRAALRRYVSKYDPKVLITANKTKVVANG